MYWRILVPLDRSQEAEGVLPLVREHLMPEGEAILLHVIPPGRTRSVEQFVFPASQQEEADLNSAMSYLRGLASHMGMGSENWRCAAVVAQSVADGIVIYAAREEVDLIVMYTHDRRGLAKLIKGSIAEKVWHKASIDVQVIKPHELVAV